MGLFKSEAPKENTEPIRRLLYKATEHRPKPFSITVGQPFRTQEGEITVTTIEFRNDMYRHSGVMVYDVYVDRGDNIEVKWKQYPHEDNLDVEYNLDF
jgi:hypothetical protein